MTQQQLRDQKFSTFRVLTKLPALKSTPTAYVDNLQDSVRLLIDHPFSGRPWTIVGPSDIPGFYHLSSRVLLCWSAYEEISLAVNNYHSEYEALAAGERVAVRVADDGKSLYLEPSEGSSHERVNHSYAVEV